MKNISKLIFGTIFLVIGFVLLLVTLNIISDISFLDNILKFWPIGFILAGILLIFKQRFLSITLFILTIIFGLFFFAITNMGYYDNTNQIKQIHTLELKSNEISNELETINYNIEILNANFNIKKIEDENNLFKLNITDYEKISEPITVVKYEDNTRDINIQKNSNNLNNLLLNKPIWNLDITDKNKINNINLQSTFSNINIYLEDLNVNNILINTQISDIEIFYSNYSTNTNIVSDISNINLYFPYDSSVLISINGDILDINLDDFTKTGNIYYSKNYNLTNNDTIIINIDTDISSITGELEK